MRRRTDVLLACGVLGGLFAIYAAGACRTIYVGDSGELVTAVATLGIPHPPGYPLYVLLGSLFLLACPLGPPAFAMSLFSAVAGALAGAVLYLACRRAGAAPAGALAGALSLGLSPTFWQEANVPRVYTLNGLFVAAVLLTAMPELRGGKPPRLALSFFLCGLGAGNHLSMLLVAAAVAVAAVPLWPSLRVWLRGAAALALGLVPYAYLPLRSRADPPLDWGDPETLARFLRVVSRRDYWQRAWIESPSDLLLIGADYLASFPEELTWAGVVAAACGAAMLTPRRLLLVPGVLMSLDAAAIALHGSRMDIFVWHRYHVPSYVAASFLVGLGVHAVLARLPRAAGVLALGVPAVLLATGWRAADRSRYRVADDFARLVLQGLPPGAHLAATDDNVLFPLMNLHLVEGVRPDVHLILQGVGTEIPATAFRPDTDPLYFTHHPNWTSEAPLEAVPAGLVFRAQRRGTPAPRPPPLPERLAGEDDPAVPKEELTRNLVGHFHFMRGLSAGDDWAEADRELREAARSAPDNDVLFYNLALVYAERGLWEEAAAAMERSHACNPRRIAAPGLVRARDRIPKLVAERDRVRQIVAELSGSPEMAGLPRGSGAWHRAMAERLLAGGERLAAVGELSRAVVAEQGARADVGTPPAR